MNRWISLGFLSGLLISAVLASAAIGRSMEGPAPDFSLPSRSGENLALSELQGQVVMINFWASWCGPCRQEMPLLEEIYQRYSGLGFTLLGVNVEEDSGDAEHWLKDTPVSFPILFDRKNQVSKLYDVVAMPSTIIVDRRGNIRYLHQGYQPGYEGDYLNQVRSLIREKE